MLHEVILWVPAGFGFNAKERRVCGSRRAAELCAESMLRPHRVVTTSACYHRDIGRAASVDIRQGGKCLLSVMPEVDIVPSVGELGWTP